MCQREVWGGSYDLVPESNDNNALLNLAARYCPVYDKS